LPQRLKRSAASEVLMVSVFWAADRMNEVADIAAVVEVIINGKSAVTVSCNPKKDIVQNMEGIDLKPTP
jgi:hypothetical protein